MNVGGVVEPLVGNNDKIFDAVGFLQFLNEGNHRRRLTLIASIKVVADWKSVLVRG